MPYPGMPEPQASTRLDRSQLVSADALACDEARGPPAYEGALLGGAYRVGRRLARGGTATIYLAERHPQGGEVVIKLARPDVIHHRHVLAHLEREASLLARLAHPHCVTLIGNGRWNGWPYLVLERIEGEPLSRLVADEGLTPVRAVAITRQVLAALEHAHSRGVLHQDVKPDNIHLARTGDGRDLATLLDFGAARATTLSAGPGAPRPIPEPPDPDARGVVVGTPSVMAPEQIRLQPVDARADVYAVGVLLYQLLVGHKPFVASETRELLLMHLYETPTPPRRALGRARISAELDRIVVRALSKAPDDRFESCAAMASALAETPEGRGRRPRRARTLTPF
jgi:eukaryotic-like serine/threonine-protein kinase